MRRCENKDIIDINPMSASKMRLVSELLNDEQNASLRNQIFLTYLDDSGAGADQIIDFAKKNGVDDLLREESIAYIDEMDDDDFDIELTVENLAAIAGGGQIGCQCLEEAHNEPWGRCPGMRPMRKWLFRLTLEKAHS